MNVILTIGLAVWYAILQIVLYFSLKRAHHAGEDCEGEKLKSKLQR